MTVVVVHRGGHAMLHARACVRIASSGHSKCGQRPDDVFTGFVFLHRHSSNRARLISCRLDIYLLPLLDGDGHSAQETLDVTSLTVELGCTCALLTQDGQQSDFVPCVIF